ncbi:MAG: oligosaccharide flippase family protein [Candidatus Parcubacteria bacterium]|nr:oligosaccharide flippase family protein [Candidatus Parcubacteria bacterium]
MINIIKTRVRGILIKTQKYTHTDNIYIFKGGFWLSLGQAMNMIILLVMSVIWARFVPKEVYGQYNYILSIAGLIAVFSLGGMEGALTPAVAKGFGKTIWPILKTKFLWSTLTVVSGCGLAIYYWINGNTILAISFLIAGIFSPLINNFSIYLAYLSGERRFDIQAKYSILRVILASAVSAGVIFLTKNVIFLIASYFIVNGFLHVLFYFLALRAVPPKGGIDYKAINFGGHLSFIGILGTFAGYIDRILVFHYLGAVQLAIYSFATLLPEQINSFLKHFQVLAIPKLAVRDEKEIKETIKKRTAILALFLIVVIGIYAISARFIFNFLFPSYSDSVFYSIIYSFSLLGAVAIIPGTTFVAKTKTKILYKYNIITNVFKIIIMFFGLHYFGLLGMIVGLVIYRNISSLLSFIFFYEDIKKTPV